MALSTKYKWIIIAWGINYFLTQEPKKIDGGYITPKGRRFIGKNIELMPRWLYIRTHPWAAHRDEL